MKEFIEDIHSLLRDGKFKIEQHLHFLQCGQAMIIYGLEYLESMRSYQETGMIQ
jgi:hypothetical protein